MSGKNAEGASEALPVPNPNTSGDDTSAGWEKSRFVSLPDERFEELQCSICLDVARDAVQCSQQHHYCASCLSAWNGKCPQCRETVDHPQPARMVRSLVSKEKLSCMFKDAGCKEIVRVSGIVAHEEICGYQSSSCPNNKCQEPLIKREVEAHRDICPWEILVCLECGMEYFRSNEKQHQCLKSIMSEFYKMKADFCALLERVFNAEEENKMLKQEVAAFTSSINEQKAIKSPKSWQDEFRMYRSDDENGYIYVGERNDNGEREGSGTLYSPEGELRFIGQWKNDKRHGWGSEYLKYSDNYHSKEVLFLTYAGPWKNNQRHGWGSVRDHYTCDDREMLFIEGREATHNMNPPPTRGKNVFADIYQRRWSRCADSFWDEAYLLSKGSEFFHNTYTEEELKKLTYSGCSIKKNEKGACIELIIEHVQFRWPDGKCTIKNSYKIPKITAHRRVVSPDQPLSLEDISFMTSRSRHLPPFDRSWVFLSEQLSYKERMRSVLNDVLRETLREASDVGADSDGRLPITDDSLLKECEPDLTNCFDGVNTVGQYSRLYRLREEFIASKGDLSP